MSLMLLAAQRRPDMQPALMIRDKNETKSSTAGSRKSRAKEGRDGGAELWTGKSSRLGNWGFILGSALCNLEQTTALGLGFFIGYVRV